MMNKLALFVLLTFLISFTVGIDYKNNVGVEMEISPPVYVQGATTLPNTSSPISVVELLELLDKLDNVEQKLRDHYFDTLSENGDPLVANLTEPVPCDTDNDHPSDFCGGEFTFTGLPRTISYGDNNTLRATNISVGLTEYVDYALRTKATCIDHATGSWSSPLTSGYTDTTKGYFHFMYGGNPTNIRHWNITFFDPNLKAGCLSYWEEFSVGVGYLQANKVERRQKELCWDLLGKCEERLKITAEDTESTKAYKNFYNEANRRLSEDGYCFATEKRGKQELSIRLNPYTGHGQFYIANGVTGEANIYEI